MHFSIIHSYDADFHMEKTLLLIAFHHTYSERILCELGPSTFGQLGYAYCAFR